MKTGGPYDWVKRTFRAEGRVKVHAPKPDVARGVILQARAVALQD